MSGRVRASRSPIEELLPDVETRSYQCYIVPGKSSLAGRS